MGQADSESDVSFLVELEAERSLFDFGGLLMELQDLLNCPVDVVTEKGLRALLNPGMKRVLDD